jgi:hypothetical protein
MTAEIPARQEQNRQIMRTNIPEWLLKIADDISANGSANLTRLASLEKWFERPERLSAFAVWIATRSTSRKGKTGGSAAELFRESNALLAGADSSIKSEECELKNERGNQPRHCGHGENV